MPRPLVCPNRECPHHRNPPRSWYIRFGTYRTKAHGVVQRFQCLLCGTTCSNQTESMHYFAKRRVSFRGIEAWLTAGATMREIARHYGLRPAVIERSVIRLGRQAMAAHALMLLEVKPRRGLCADGLRSVVTSKDYPCDITTVADPKGETIISAVHTTFIRGGTMRPEQKQRLEEKLEVWRPKVGTMRKDISLVFHEMWDYLRPDVPNPITIDTDEHPLYLYALGQDPAARHWKTGDLLVHRRTSSTEPRTSKNPLAAVNYIDRMIRHRVREHFRQTTAIGRNANPQMHRFWIFAFDLNCRRPWRVRKPDAGVHAAQDTVPAAAVKRILRGFYTRRINLEEVPVPETLRRVWMQEVPTPPHLWRRGQKEATGRVPAFAIRDLAA